METTLLIGLALILPLICKIIAKNILPNCDTKVWEDIVLYILFIIGAIVLIGSWVAPVGVTRVVMH